MFTNFLDYAINFDGGQFTMLLVIKSFPTGTDCREAAKEVLVLLGLDVKVLLPNTRHVHLLEVPDTCQTEEMCLTALKMGIEVTKIP